MRALTSELNTVYTVQEVSEVEVKNSPANRETQNKTIFKNNNKLKTPSFSTNSLLKATWLGNI